MFYTYVLYIFLYLNNTTTVPPIGSTLLLNTPPLYSVPNHHRRSYLVLSGRLEVLTALNPLLADRLVVGIFAVDCTEFLGLCCYPTKENY